MMIDKTAIIHIELDQLIPLKTDELSLGTAKDLNIYLVLEGKPVLYKRAGIPITEEHIKDLKDNEIDTIYIKKTECKLFIQEIEREIATLLDNKPICLETVKRWIDKIFSLSEAILSVPTKENLKAAQRITKDISEAIENNPEIAYLTAFALKKDIATSIHIANVHALSSGFAYHLGLRKEKLETIVTGSFFHDIGKIKVPDHILKKPGKLTDTEYEMIKKHTTWGYYLLNKMSFRKYAPIALYHHEFLDGTGYPEGLKNGEIPEEAKIVQICDIYEAITGIRPYRDSEPPFSALTTIKENFVIKGKIDKNLYKEFVIYLYKNKT